MAKFKSFRWISMCLTLSSAFLNICALGSDQVPVPSQNILIYGDAGRGDQAQTDVAAAMLKRHQSKPFDFAVSTGDNQYTQSAPNIMLDIFEKPYADMIKSGVVFYQTIGNHDMEENRVAEHLAYSISQNVLARKVGGWALPAENYVIRKPGLKWIVLNVSKEDSTFQPDADFVTFSEKEICEKSEDWKVVSLHYPLWTTGRRGDNKAMIDYFAPLIARCKVDFVLNGHEHFGEVMLPYNWSFLATVGHAGEIRTEAKASARESLWRTSEIGFSELNLKGEIAQFSFFNTNKPDPIFAAAIQKRPDFWADTWKRGEGQRVLGRVSLPPGTNREDLEAEMGVSDKCENPLLAASNWTFQKATAEIRYDDFGLSTYGSDLPKDIRSGCVVYRYRIKSTGGIGRWIYGDLSDGPGKHGNYDGIRADTLMRL